MVDDMAPGDLREGLLHSAGVGDDLDGTEDMLLTADSVTKLSEASSVLKVQTVNTI